MLKIEKYLNDIFTGLLDHIQNNLTQMFLIRPSTKIAQTIPLFYVIKTAKNR